MKGEIAFISQSGAMVLSILDWSYQVGLGFSKFISLGNKADLTEADFIEDASEDPNTKVILCYIEDVEDGAHFLDVARRASRKKPIVILKSGPARLEHKLLLPIPVLLPVVIWPMILLSNRVA